MLKLLTPFVLAFAIITQMACGANDLHKLHDVLNKAAKLENAAAKSNHAFYEGGIYGPVGSEGAIKIRQKAATVVHDSNEKLIVALNLAKSLTEATFEQGKLAVLQALAQAASGLTTGNQTIDLVLQSIATVINQAIVIVQAFRASDLPSVVPFIQSWQIQEVAA